MQYSTKKIVTQNSRVQKNKFKQKKLKKTITSWDYYNPRSEFIQKKKSFSIF